MTNDYIRREDAIRLAEQGQVQGFPWQFLMLVRLPSADVAPVVHSQWVLGGYDDMYYVCERCGHKQSEYYHKPTANFCPNCGAKMDGGDEHG